MNIDRLFSNQKTDHIIIPFGGDCTVTHYLRIKGLRKIAFPFDWNVTPIQSMIELIRNDFDEFLINKQLIYLPPVRRLLFDEDGHEIEIKNDFITPVVCKRYEILFTHDFSINGKDDLLRVRNKYERRIEKLIELLNSEIHLLFVYFDGSINEWQQLQYRKALGYIPPPQNLEWKKDFKLILSQKYPALSYDLIDFTCFKEKIEDTFLNRIRRTAAKIIKCY